MDDPCALFAALADPIRLRCVALMQREGALCVCEVTHALDIPQPKASKHLASLRDAGLVKDRRDAQWVFYVLSEALPPWAATAVAAACQGIATDPRHQEDQERLHTMSGRPVRSRVV